MTTDLDRMVKYLRNCWAEERDVATVTAAAGRWRLGEEGWRVEIYDGKGRLLIYVPSRAGDPDSFAVGEYIAEHNPHAALADLDAKERLLDHLGSSEPAVRILLQRYAANPDFPTEWRLPDA